MAEEVTRRKGEGVHTHSDTDACGTELILNMEATWIAAKALRRQGSFGCYHSAGGRYCLPLRAHDAHRRAA